jgi:DNA helicase HerA-like ATPase
LPEVGDVARPKLCFFFDEAHLLFDDASEALLEQIERTARLIRSKGVGIYFVTHAPTDVAPVVLSQLGNRVQHALRAFTPDDADALRKTVRTFPMTEFYDLENLLTSLGIGEAAVTVLSTRGIPTPLAATRLLAPDSSMEPLEDAEFQRRVASSPLNVKYGAVLDRESAHERLTTRQVNARAAAAQEAARRQMSPTTNAGLNTMTPAQQRREIQRQAREAKAAQKAAEREAKARAAEQRRAERERQRSIDNAIRTGGRVITSRAGQSVLRRVLDAILGGGRR